MDLATFSSIAPAQLLLPATCPRREGKYFRSPTLLPQTVLRSRALAAFPHVFLGRLPRRRTPVRSRRSSCLLNLAFPRLKYGRPCSIPRSTFSLSGSTVTLALAS